MTAALKMRKVTPTEKPYIPIVAYHLLNYQKIKKNHKNKSTNSKKNNKKQTNKQTNKQTKQTNKKSRYTIFIGKFGYERGNKNTVKVLTTIIIA